MKNKINPIYFLLMLIGLSVLVVAGAFTITLNSPINYANMSGTNINFNATSSSTVNLLNQSLWHNETGTFHRNQTTLYDAVLNVSTAHGITDTTTGGAFFQCFGIELDMTNGTRVISSITKYAASGVQEAYILNSTLSPMVTASFSGDVAILNYTLTGGDTYIVCGNATSGTVATRYVGGLPVTGTYFKWNRGRTDSGYDTNAYHIESVNVSEDVGITSDEEVFINNLTSGGIWGFEACDEDGVCGFSSNYTYYVAFLENLNTYNLSTYQTKTETFTLNITSTATPTAKLYLNNSDEGTPTITTYGGDNYIVNTTLDINETWDGSIQYYYEITQGGTTANSSINTVTVTPLYLDFCNSTLTQKYLNLTFQDEDLLTFIQNHIPTSTFYYWLGAETNRKTVTYTNTTASYELNFCSNAVNETLHTQPYIQYKNTTDYPQRTYNTTSLDLNNFTTNLTLYSLATADGIYVTFQVVNTADQVLSGVNVNATREIDGTDTIVGDGVTGADGGITFWLNPDFSHDFVFNKEGYTQYSTSLFPTQTSYTITLGGGTGITNSTFRGIDYSILPTNSYLWNDTVYTFGFNLTSSYWDVTDYGFDLRLANGSRITGGNTGTEGTPLTLSYNTTNQSIIYLDYYWVINGNYTNATRYWTVQNTDYTGWSIATFFTDLNSYLDTGMFGIDNFGRYLFAFLALFLVVGIMSYKYGLTSPMAITTLIFAIVFFFDVVAGLIPSIRGISYLPTYVSLIMLAIVIIREVQKQ